MNYKVLVKKEVDQITARVVSFPEIIVTGTDEQIVLTQLRKKLSHLLENTQLIELDLTPNPWLQFAGMWADDKDWDVFQAEIKAYRESFDVVSD